MNKSFPIIKGRKIRLAIVGCGRISKSHFNSIEKNQNNIKLISICDNQMEILSKNEIKYKVKGYVELNDMLKHENLDLVALCTPSGSHAIQTEICAKHGVNVMTEKPMATRWQDGLRMVKVCNDERIRLFVIKQNRSNPTLQLLKRAINENRFGKINMFNFNIFWNRPQEYYDQAPWRGTREHDGGAFMNQASHYIDLLEWLLGPIDKVQSIISTTRDIEVEDTGVINVRCRNGALGSINVTMLTYLKNFEGSITILGEKGTVRIGGVAANEVHHWEFDEKKDYDDKIKEANYQTKSVYGFGHELYYKNVIESLQGKTEPDTDGREGLKSLEIIIAAYLSAKENKTISLPLKSQSRISKT